MGSFLIAFLMICALFIPMSKKLRVASYILWAVILCLMIASYSFAGEVYPVTGDWSGTGSTKVGIFKDGEWYLDFDGDGTFNPSYDRQYTFGSGLADQYTSWSQGLSFMAGLFAGMAFVVPASRQW